MTGAKIWEQRWHPLRGEWVLFTTHRSGRPWLGERKVADEAPRPRYDPTCALCPGNKRLQGRNPDYRGAYWFTNDLPVFGGPELEGSGDELYRRAPASGTAEVVCYHPDHNRTMAQLSEAEVEAVVRLWTERTAELAARPEINHVFIFENKGEQVGTSNPHPHCQIYAGSMIYQVCAREAEVAADYHARQGALLGLEVAGREASAGRVIARNEHFLACVPWFARFAYEVLVLPRFQAAMLTDLDAAQMRALGSILREVTIRYDNLWRMPLPYIMVIHQAPCDGRDVATFPFHVEFHPPLRTPDTMKYLAGPETGGGSMTNEMDPDAAAAQLQAVSGTQRYDRGEAGA